MQWRKIYYIKRDADYNAKRKKKSAIVKRVDGMDRQAFIASSRPATSCD